MNKQVQDALKALGVEAPVKSVAIGEKWLAGGGALLCGRLGGAHVARLGPGDGAERQAGGRQQAQKHQIHFHPRLADRLGGAIGRD